VEGRTCDFCSAQSVYAEYPCAEFMEPTLGRTLNRVWVACRTRHEFIQADQWDRLVERAFQQACAAGRIEPMNREYSCEVFRQCYANFREHRTGPPQLIGLPLAEIPTLAPSSRVGRPKKSRDIRGKRPHCAAAGDGSLRRRVQTDFSSHRESSAYSRTISPLTGNRCPYTYPA
jgi:hypothetical protein